LINPLHAVAPGVLQEPSPYFPSSRRWRNPLYLRVEHVPGAAVALGAGLAALAEAGRALNSFRLIDRSRVWELKREALTRLWAVRTADDGAFEQWVTDAGAALTTFATHAALAEEYGGDWRAWPAELRRPSEPAVARFARGPGADRVMFHCWLQWLLDAQLAAAAVELPLVTDLAIGADPGGADAWEWQNVHASGVSVGAPPDDFSPLGQDWGFPPFDPWRLRAAGYGPWIELVRAALTHARGLRIDHVAGLFRQYWVPSAAGPANGVYVRYPWADLCNILALEAHRAGALIVGEDLGTVEPDVRRALADANVLSYRLLWFEDEPPGRWPVAALAAVTTHDLPTVAGAWLGADADDRRAVGATIDDEADDRMRARLARVAGVRVGRDSVTDAVVGGYRALAASPCLLVAVTLEDALEIVERPNLPGTLVDRPNWSLALPLPLEALERDPRLDELAAVMRAARPIRE
jgi:4-alpha-glucanotransferase